MFGRRAALGAEAELALWPVVATHNNSKAIALKTICFLPFTIFNHLDLLGLADIIRFFARPMYRERAPNDLIKQRVDGSGCPDSECERQHSRGSQGGIPFAAAPGILDFHSARSRFAGSIRNACTDAENINAEGTNITAATVMAIISGSVGEMP